MVERQLTAEQISQATKISVAQARKVVELRDQKLQGKRIIIPDSSEVKKGIDFAFNDPSFLKGRSAILGRSSVVPQQSLPSGTKFNPKTGQVQGQGIPISKKSSQSSKPNIETDSSKDTKKTISNLINNPQLVGIGLPNPIGFGPKIKQDVTFQEISENTPKFVGKVSGASSVLLTTINPVRQEKLSEEKIEKSFERGEKVGRFVGEVFSEFIPTTPKKVAVTGALTGAGLGGAKVVRTGVSIGLSVVGTKTALDPFATPSQRVAGGLTALGAGTGFVAETTPFFRGLRNVASKEFKPVKTQEKGFTAIELSETEVIGLIKEKSPARTGQTKDVDLPATSPLVRGGFEVKPFEKKLFLGEGDVATSQIGFFKQGKEIPLDREFFVTPREPTLKIAETRLSRLGLDLDLFKRPKKLELGFGLPKPSQIGIERGALVTKKGFGSSFKIGKGTELEATKTTGAVIKDVKRVGRTTIKGQGVDIFEFTSGKGSKVSKGFSKNELGFTTKKGTRVSAETGLLTKKSFTRTGTTTKKPSTSKLIPLRSEPSLPTRSPSIPKSPPTRSKSPPKKNSFSLSLKTPTKILSIPSLSRGRKTKAITTTQKKLLLPRRPKTKKLKPKKKKFEDDLFFTPDFTSNVLRIKKELTPKQIKSIARKGGGRFGLRPIPLIKTKRKGKKAFRGDLP